MFKRRRIKFPFSINKEFYSLFYLSLFCVVLELAFLYYKEIWSFLKANFSVILKLIIG